ALMDYTGRGPRPHTVRYHDAPVSARDLAEQAREALTTLIWRHGTKAGPGNPEAAMAGRFAALRVRPANRYIPRDEAGTLPVEWLLVEWPETAAEPTDYWLSTLPETTPPAELVRLAKIRRCTGTATASSSTAWAWTTSRAGPGWAGSVTPPWSPQSTCSSPPSAWAAAQKRRGRPELLPGPDRTPGRSHPAPRPLPVVRTEGSNLTKYY
ncbi:hypothetical protein HGG74_21045, partial [Arthrobacter sp. E918]|nr:hypothetical protein [Arthrobacter mobilis]